MSAAHECIYGVTAGGNEEITETLIGGNIDSPMYKTDEGYHIGLMQDYFDRRRDLATHYNYCPYCGRKLDYKKIKQLAKEIDWWWSGGGGDSSGS